MFWAGSGLHQRREKLGHAGDVLLREESGLRPIGTPDLSHRIKEQKMWLN
jgi:hypothetical protein